LRPTFEKWERAVDDLFFGAFDDGHHEIDPPAVTQLVYELALEKRSGVELEGKLLDAVLECLLRWSEDRMDMRKR
jgi:hypothetical protein